MWGTEAHLRTLFGAGISELRTRAPRVHLPVPLAEHFLDVPADHTTARCSRPSRPSTTPGARPSPADLQALMTEANTATGTLAIPSEYLEVVATRSA